MTTRIPSYRKKKTKTGVYAVVTIPDGLGRRRDILLGKYGSKESRLEYARVIAEWEASGRHNPPTAVNDTSVNEVILAYYAESYYRHPDGTPTSEVNNLRLALRPLKALYGHTPAAKFDAAGLEAIRVTMIQDGHCRNQINNDIARIKRVFKWAASKKLVSSSIFHDLTTLDGLRAGRSDAKETAPVLPVPRLVVEQTITVMTPTLGDMVRLQLETSMRPGEVCAMRAIDIDMTGKVWLYQPATQKTKHHGQARVVPLGPKAQEIIRRHLKTDLQAYLFTPEDSMAEFRARQRQKRKSKVPPSQQDRRNRSPKRRPTKRWAKSSYAIAVTRACDKAFPPPEHLQPKIKGNGKREARKQFLALLTKEEKIELLAWRKKHRWHPHQLRHTRAMELKREAGLDVARAVLGHRSPIITEHYATLDLAAASELMEKIG